MNNYINKTRGVTLIELMVSITLGLFLVLAATTLFSTNKRISNDIQSLGRIQEAGRTAVEILTHDLRMSGHYGCSHDRSTINGNGLTTGTELNPVEGFNSIPENNNVSASNWFPSDIGAPGGRSAMGGDGITVRYFQPIGTLAVAMTDGINMLIPEDDAAGIASEQILVVSNCSGSDVFKVKKVASTADSDGNKKITTTKAIRNYGKNAMLSTYVERRYYVVDDAGSRALAWEENGAAATAALPGIESMNILYGVDNNGDQLADEFSTADGVSNWDNVVSVELAFLVRSPRQDAPAGGATTYQMLNDNVTPTASEKYQRHLFTSTVYLRNNSLR